MDPIGDAAPTALSGRSMPATDPATRSSAGPPTNRPGLHVTAENVLRVRATLLAESDRLYAAVAEVGYVGRCGGDPLSGEVATAFNRRIEAVVARCRDQADRLAAAGRSLERVARQYGHTEAEIVASYRSPNRAVDR